MLTNNNQMQDFVIIVAGGKGLRMGSDIPKQFLPIGGKPVLMWTLERFREYSADLQIILVLPEAQQDYWRQLCEQYHFQVQYQLANGGQTRFHSVQNGLSLIPDDAEGVVGVHDGVRPFPAIDVIRNCYETARTAKAVIPVVPVVETLRHVYSSGLNGLTRTETTNESEKVRCNNESEEVRKVRCNNESEEVRKVRCNNTLSTTVPRGDYRLVQTPQTFDIQLLKAAYKRAQNQTCLDSAEREQSRPKVKAANRQPYNDGFTDDASVVEAYGFDITLVEGNRENIKITTPYDITVAEAILTPHPSPLTTHPSPLTTHPSPLTP